MKKTLAAVAVLGAFAGSALAADVTLYGKVDLGVSYQHSDNGDVTTDNWGLDSGLSSGSRFGLKGSEQISEGLTVGFQLEHGFDADDGEDGSARAFHREARLYVATDYGTLHMGRFGALDSGTGSVDVAADFSASGTGYNGIIDQSTVFATYSRMDNSIAYTSPEFAGLTVHAMASLGSDYDEADEHKDLNADKEGLTPDWVWTPGEKTGAEATHKVDRYYGLGVTGQWGALGAGLVVSQMDFGSVQSEEADDNALNVTAGVNYDFGVAKTYLAANYYDEGQNKAGEEYSQWGVSASVAAPIGAGTLEAAVAYGVQTDENAAGVETETKVIDLGAFYKYPLSKRTYLYTAAGYTQEDEDGADDKVKTVNFISGICHNF